MKTEECKQFFSTFFFSQHNTACKAATDALFFTLHFQSTKKLSSSFNSSPFLFALLMEFNLENPLTSFNDHLDAVPALFAGESDHMPSLLSFNDQISFSIRREAFSLTYRVSFNFPELLHFLPFFLTHFVDSFER